MPAPPRFLIGAKPRRAGAGSRLAKPSRSDAEGGLDAAPARRTIEAEEAGGLRVRAPDPRAQAHDRPRQRRTASAMGPGSSPALLARSPPASWRSIVQRLHGASRPPLRGVASRWLRQP